MTKIPTQDLNLNISWNTYEISYSRPDLQLLSLPTRVTHPLPVARPPCDNQTGLPGNG